MANYLYAYNRSYGIASTVPGSSASPEAAFKHSTAALASSVYQLPSSDVLGSSSADAGGTADAAYTWDAAGIKRSSQALYYQSIYGAQSTIGQTEAWYTSNSLSKRPRVKNASNLPIYPQRPGEKDCAHYMLTRTCKFGHSCKFDHPIWVPEGGIPDWKEVSLPNTPECFPERPGEPDCPYFIKTQRCSFGSRCKFNHPKDKNSTLGAPGSGNASALPERPQEPPCAFYMKTGTCKFGATCKFNHPKDIMVLHTAQENGDGELKDSLSNTGGMIGDVNIAQPLVNFSPALLHNSKGLPVRLGEVDCPFYLKTGSCKYGATCRYNHPDRNAINPPAAAIDYTILAPSAGIPNIVTPVASIYPVVDPTLPQTMLGVVPSVYPQRPGQMECDYYMKTGECKFSERCKFHHPIDRSAQSQKVTNQSEEVKLTLAGLPRREGAAHCPYYMKTGTCKYGATCKFDHPPPGE
ncbi:hypothetical protein CRG98_024883, partial [Punica granatum]